VSFIISETQTQYFQILNIGKLYYWQSGINLKQNLFIDIEENLDNADVERKILKYKQNYIWYFELHILYRQRSNILILSTLSDVTSNI
jgi:hypothetical protein